MGFRWVALGVVGWLVACGESSSGTSPAGSAGRAGLGGNASAGSQHGGAAGSSAESGTNAGGKVDSGEGGTDDVGGSGEGGAAGSTDVEAPGGAENTGGGGESAAGLGGAAGGIGDGGTPGGGAGGEGNEPPPCPKPDDEICHELVVSDNSDNRVSYVNEFTSNKPGAVAWSKSVVAVPRSIEIVANAQANGGKAALIGTHSGYVELDLSDGSLLADVKVAALTTARSASRMPDGNTALALNDEIRIVSPAGAAVRNFALPAGAGLGVVHRDPATGHFWFGKGIELYGVADTGQVLWNESLPAGAKAQAVWWRAGGGAYASTGDPATLIEVDSAGTVQETLGGKVTFSELDFLAGFARLANGNFVTANWLGHIASPSEQAPQVVELTPDNELVWKWGTQTLARQILDVYVLR